MALVNRKKNKGGGRKRGQGKRNKIYAENSKVILVKGKKEEIERKSLSNEKESKDLGRELLQIARRKRQEH